MTPAAFDGFRPYVFDAYRPEKWSSNVFTRERLEAKQRLLALARSFQPLLEEQGLELQLYASDEYPSLWNRKQADAQWVFFWSDEDERRSLEAQVDVDRSLAATVADPTPMRRHAYLDLRLDLESLELAFRIHRDAWLDRRNLVSRASSDAGTEPLVEALHALPSPMVVAVGDGGELAPEGVTVGTLRELLAEDCQGESFFRAGLTLGRDEAVGLGAELAGFLAERLPALVTVYRLVAWSEHNDHLRSDEEFVRRLAARGARREELEADAARHREELEVRQQSQLLARRELEEQFRRESAARASRPRVPVAQAPTTARDDAPPGAERRPRPESRTVTRPARARREEPGGSPREARRPAPPRDLEPAEPVAVQVGHRVRIGKGPLAGQVGTVQDIDSKGTVRVMVGLLASRLPLEDLIGLGPAATDDPSARR